jgi:hypothetical protein
MHHGRRYQNQHKHNLKTHTWHFFTLIKWLLTYALALGPERNVATNVNTGYKVVLETILKKFLSLFENVHQWTLSFARSIQYPVHKPISRLSLEHFHIIAECNFRFTPIPVAVGCKAWLCGRLNPARGHGCLSFVSSMCCQVEVPATDRSLVKRIPTQYVCMSLSVIICNNNPVHLKWVGRKRSD